MIASRTHWAIRFARVASVFELAMIQRAPFLAEGGNADQFFAAATDFASAAVKSAGSSSRSIASRSDHEPSAFAASIFARPIDVIRPLASSASILRLLTADHGLPVFRGEKYSIVRRSSSFRGRLSIHPKQRASSTASPSVNVASPDDCLR